MPRLCERPGCAEPAAVAWGFDPRRQVVWLETYDEESDAPGRLCRRHAEGMTLPRGWWLEDRRAPDHLFPSPEPAPPEPAPPARRRAKAAPRPATEPTVVPEPEPEPVSGSDAVEVPGVPEAADAAASTGVAALAPAATTEAPAGPPTEAEATEAPAAAATEAPPTEGSEHPPGWSPDWAEVDDAPVFDASSPLLARAFGKGPAPEPPKRRSRRPRKASSPPPVD